MTAKMQGTVGDAADVRDVLQRVLAAVEGMKRPYPRAWALAEMAKALAQAGDEAGARYALQRALEAVEEIEEHSHRAEALAAVAQALAQVGDEASARHALQRALEAAGGMKRKEELTQAIAEIAATMPLARTVQLYQFALFLKTHPLPNEEIFEEITADEALWEEQFATTKGDQLAALLRAVEAEISEGKTLPMFDEKGEFIEHQ